MTKRIVNVINNKNVSIQDLHFQYFPSRFIRELYGDDGNMMLVKNSPHYYFLKKYEEVGDAILSIHTNYYKMHSAWGRNDAFICNKTKKFIEVYNNIKKNGYKQRISVVEKPLYERVFDNGFEIYDGHHRAAACAVLGYKEINCNIVNVKFI